MSKKQPFLFSTRILIPLAPCLAIVLLTLWFMPRETRSRAVATRPALPVGSHSNGSTGSQAASVPEAVRLRPLPVTLSSTSNEWTAEDATDPNIMERIAHNPDEFIRLAEENSRIKRRQLVYRKETVPMLIQRANGQPLKHITLPGLDGREVDVEVTETHLANPNAGSIQGRVRGRLNSMVSVGFFNGCESFNVISPDEGLYLTADAREPGEVLVKEIDPDQYVPPTVCQPVTGNTPAPSQTH